MNTQNPIVNLDGNLPEKVELTVGQSVVFVRPSATTTGEVALGFHYHGTDASQERFFLRDTMQLAVPAGYEAKVGIKAIRTGTGEIIIRYNPRNKAISGYEKTIVVVALA
jgi:hypothetical protein